jgi:hypothetical protein
MKLTIIDTNFTTSNEWLFKLKDKENNIFYILNPEHYRQIALKSPILRNQLHYYFKGSVITAEVKEFNTRKVVTSVLEYSLA